MTVPVSVVGEVFDAYEIDEYGTAWVQNVCSEPGGRLRSHSLALAAHEM